MNGELTEEQKAQVLYATRSGVLDLIAEQPELAMRMEGDDLVQVYLAGVVAGAHATVRVFEVVSRDLLEET